MDQQSLPAPALRIGYPSRTKAASLIVTGIGGLLTYTTLTGGAAEFVFLPGGLVILGLLLVTVTYRGAVEVDRESLRLVGLRGARVFSRADYLGCEVVDERGGKPGVLVRFRSGVALVSESRGCSNPSEIRSYLESHWGVPAAQPSAGPVEHDLVLEYESLHLILLGVATLGLAALAAMGPMFWSAGVLAFLTGRTLYFALSARRILVNATGVSVFRPFQEKFTIPWEKIATVRYRYSPAHGCMVIADGTSSLRVYRWIRDYPKFNRVVQDKAPKASLPEAPPLPWKISLNRSRNSSWVVLALTSGVSMWLFNEGAWPAGLIFTGAPALTFLITVLASGRHIEISPDELRLTERKSFSVTTRRFRRADLTDMRLGRQLRAGGLWLRFGAERLEIGNLDAEFPPEQILAVLRREWQWEPKELRSSEFRAA